MGRQGNGLADDCPDERCLHRSFQALHHEHADVVDLRSRQHAVQHPVLLCGAYTLAQNAHVRGDFLYSSMRPRHRQASTSCSTSSSSFRASSRWFMRLFLRCGSGTSTNIPTSPRTARQFITQDRHPIAGALICCRASPRSCAVSCVSRPVNGRAGCTTSPRSTWSGAARQQRIRGQQSRKIAIEGAAQIDEMARQRGMGGDTQT